VFELEMPVGYNLEKYQRIKKASSSLKDANKIDDVKLSFAF